MELSFLANIASTVIASPSFAGVGERQIDLSVLPAGTRHIFFVATIASSAGSGTVSHVELWNITRNELVTGTQLNNSLDVSPTVFTTHVSAQLTEGTTSGTIRNNSTDEYEARIYRSGGTGSDTAFCSSAYIRIIYV